MTGLVSRIHARIGDLWWYTILMFVAQRFGDAINFFVGLWIVPRYVPQSELGAVMPLTQFVSFVGIPLAIVAMPFMKFLGVYAARGEMGKVKALLRDVFVGTGVMAFVTLLLAWLVMPFVFERMRVPVGSLGILIVGVSILGAGANIFQNAVNGLKEFRATIWFNVLAAPLRLLLMLATMPFRALSGYFVGQGTGPAVIVLGSLWTLRKRLGADVKTQPYWREDGREIWNYTWPLALLTVSTILFGAVDQLVIRHRLTDFDSAGYYMISRFAEAANYLGSAFVVFLFPLVAGRSQQDAASRRVLLHSVCGTFLGGLSVALLLLVFGRSLLGLTEQWRIYQPLAYEMFLLAVYNMLTVVCSCFYTYEAAQGRFRFLWYLLPLFSFKAVALYCVTGYTFFIGRLPQAWIDAVAALQPNRLDFLLYVFIGFHLVFLPLLVWDVFGRRAAAGPADS